MRKSILAFMGSPRKNGNSTVLAKQIVEGALAAGARVESFYLHKMKISPSEIREIRGHLTGF